MERRLNGIRHLDRVHFAGEPVILAGRVFDTLVVINPLNDRLLVRTDCKLHKAVFHLILLQHGKVHIEVHTDLSGQYQRL